MKKSNVFMALGAAVLSVGAFLTTKADKKFTGVNAAHVFNVSGVTVNASGHLTTSSTSTRTAYFATRHGASTTVLHTLITLVAPSGNLRVYFH